MKLYRTVITLPFLVLLGCASLQPESGSFLAPVSIAGGADYWLGQVNGTHGLPPSEFWFQKEKIDQALGDRGGFGGVIVHSYETFRPYLSTQP